MYAYGNSMFLATHGILARGGGVVPSLLLDTYPNAAVAYSLRKLRTAYSGSAIRVRRSVDNTEQDIGFSGNDLDTTTMLDFVGYNLWAYSEDISQTIYVKSQLNITGTPAYVDVETAPDGTLTGDKIIENTASASHLLNTTGFTSIATDYNVSLYLKQAERTKVQIQSNFDGTFRICDVDLTNGNISNNTFVNTPVVTAEANGWYRFSVTILAIASAGRTLRVYLNNGTSISYTGDGTSGVYVWGFQLSQTSTVKTYQKTVATAGGAGFISEWYDQSTNANKSIQTTPTNQAQVVLNGNLILDVGTNKITTTWTTDTYTLGSSIAIAQGNYQLAVFRRTVIGANGRIVSLGSNLAPPWIGLISSTDALNSNYGGGTITQGTGIATGIYLQSIYRDTSNNVSAYNNGVALTGGTDSTTGQNITRFGLSGSNVSFGQKQELVYWNNDQSANRTGIETNVNTYWNAY